VTPETTDAAALRSPMTAHCCEVLSPSPDPPGIKSLRILERVEGFLLQRFTEGGEFVDDAQFETLDEAMRYVYSEYEEVSDWRACPDDARDLVVSRATPR
jgi:hypothetical protein